MEINKCKVCKRMVREENKSNLCSNHQDMRLLEALNKGIVVMK